MSESAVALLIPIILKWLLGHILLINKNVMDSFAYVPGEVALQATQNWERPFSLFKKRKRNKEIKAGKQNPH